MRAAPEAAPAVAVNRLTVVQLIPALEAGGAERSTLEVGAALARAGHRSVVVSAGGRMVARLRAEGSEHIEMAIGAKSLRTLRCVGALRRCLQQLDPDIVHARSRLPAWIAWRARRAPATARPHFVTTVHGLNSPGWYSGILVRGERVICVSDTVRRYVARHYPAVDPGRLVVIPRGVDPAEFPRGHQPAPGWVERFTDELRELERPALPLLVLPARGTRLKGHHDAVRVLARLATAHALDANLLLLGARERGRESYLAELEALARSLGVSGRLAISAPRRDVRDVYAVSACVLQLSTQAEAFGRTVVEALSLGVPVVGYAHGGVGELLAEGFPAGAVPVGDVEAAAARVAGFLGARPDVPPLRGYLLSDMQAATLAVYDAVASPAGERAR